MRFLDLEIAIEVAVETVKRPTHRGVRAEVADRRKIGRTIVTDAIKRIEAEIGVSLFESDKVTLTRNGHALAYHGPRFTEAKGILFEWIVEGRNPSRSENPNENGLD
jgi:hypothetical protein